MFETLMNSEDLKKIKYLENKKVESVLEYAATLLKPEKIIVVSDDPKEIEKIRYGAIENKEEMKLAMEGHTVHWDGYFDQGRDPPNTKVLLPKGWEMSKRIRTIDRDDGLKDIEAIMDGLMKGKTMIVAFYCLGPVNSRFSISAMQITDSFYVAHSEFILYRPGFEQMKRLKNKDNFFYFIHSAGELDERNTTINVKNRRIFIDLKEERVLTVNNQYAGNSLASKKLALRLGINRANNEDWLAEHMFISGIKPLDKDRKTYFAGAYPSACGKTSTAMIPGNSILGDDISYLRKDEEGNARIVNIEQGIFGIITDVNEKDDPYIWEVLSKPREMIFSNILISKDLKPYWLNMGIPEDAYPIKGLNHSGEWYIGMTEDKVKGYQPKEGEAPKKIGIAHANARYTISLEDLENKDESLHDPNGVILDGILYGGRDSFTSVPVSQCFSWEHGVYTGATLESETTSAIINMPKTVRQDPMANIDFVVAPFGKYIDNHLKFGASLKRVPKVFSTNYFLKHPETGNFLNEKVDKRVWVLWAEGRVHNDYGAIETPIGFIPKYEDIANLFKRVFNRQYSKEDYVNQFSVRVQKYLEKCQRIEDVYKSEPNMPETFWKEHEALKERLNLFKEKTGKEIISPFDL